MTEHIMQCCYTNAVKETGGKISSGWQAVAVTENIPSDAYTNCVNLQNANSTIQSHMVDEQGNVLNLLEITGDGSYVYVSRTQYGLTDRLGRPNMFSHAYIFSWKQEDILRDPNRFLTLTADNFAKDEESAAAPKDGLKRAAPFTLERALERAGMTDESYLTLIQCVYARYTDRKATKPVFVQYDGTDEQLQAILYCVYCGLPYFVRRNLSVASTAAGASKSHHLVFSTAAAGHDSYVLPQTGENNVLTPRTLRRIDRYGFVDHAVRNWRSLDMNDYFQKLEKLAAELGDASASDKLILKTAHLLIQDPSPSALSDEELSGRLSDALHSLSRGSQRMEEYICDMLEETCRRRISLTEESEADLAQWLAAPVTARLPDAGEQYNIYILSTLPLDDAARRLHNLPKPVFERYSHALEKSDGGLAILDHYYAAYGLEGGEITWKALGDLLAETRYLPNPVEVKNRVDQEAWELYDRQLQLPGQAQSACQSLLGLMRVLLPQDQLADCAESAKERYWDTISLEENFTYRNLEEYQAMRCGYPPCELYLKLCGMIRIYESSGEERFLRELSHLSSQESQLFEDQEGADTIREALERELCRIDPQARKLSSWIDAVSIPGVKPVLDSILELRQHMARQNYLGVINAFQQIAQEGPDVGGGRLLRIVAESTEEECLRHDSQERWVPLDIWLTLGRALYPNDIFRIFDEHELCLTHADESRVVGQSKLLQTPSCLRQAEDYVQAKRKSAKAVQKWLNVVKRRRQSDERRQRKDTDGSFLGSIFSQLPFGGGDGSRDKPDGRAPSQDRDPSAGRDAARGKTPSRGRDEPWPGGPGQRDSSRPRRDDRGRRKK